MGPCGSHVELVGNGAVARDVQHAAAAQFVPQLGQIRHGLEPIRRRGEFCAFRVGPASLIVGWSQNLEEGRGLSWWASNGLARNRLPGGKRTFSSLFSGGSFPPWTSLPPP